MKSPKIRPINTTIMILISIDLNLKWQYIYTDTTEILKFQVLNNSNKTKAENLKFSDYIDFYLTQMRYWIDLRGVMNQTKLVSGRFGFSRGSGSSRPRPAGDFSVSSKVIKWISASTLPLNHILTFMRRISLGSAQVWG